MLFNIDSWINVIREKILGKKIIAPKPIKSFYFTFMLKHNKLDRLHLKTFFKSHIPIKSGAFQVDRLPVQTLDLAKNVMNDKRSSLLCQAKKVLCNWSLVFISPSLLCWRHDILLNDTCQNDGKMILKQNKTLQSDTQK